MALRQDGSDFGLKQPLAETTRFRQSATDERDYVSVFRLTAREVPDGGLVDLAGCKVEAGKILIGREACRLHEIWSRIGVIAFPIRKGVSSTRYRGQQLRVPA